MSHLQINSVEKNTGLQILKQRLQKLRQDIDAPVGGEVSNNKAPLHRAHSCSSLFGLQQSIVNRHRRLSCHLSGQLNAAATILDIFGADPVKTAASKTLKPPNSCKKNSLIQFISPGCFDVC